MVEFKISSRAKKAVQEIEDRYPNGCSSTELMNIAGCGKKILSEIFIFWAISGRLSKVSGYDSTVRYFLTPTIKKICLSFDMNIPAILENAFPRKGKTKMQSRKEYLVRKIDELRNELEYVETQIAKARSKP